IKRNQISRAGRTAMFGNLKLTRATASAESTIMRGHSNICHDTCSTDSLFVFGRLGVERALECSRPHFSFLDVNTIFSLSYVYHNYRYCWKYVIKCLLLLYW